MDIERMKAQVKRYLAQIHSFDALLFPAFSNQPTWDMWADSCHELSTLSLNLSEVTHDLGALYELSIKEQEEEGVK